MLEKGKNGDTIGKITFSMKGYRRKAGAKVTFAMKGYRRKVEAAESA